jgi:hypothetical protein
MMNNGRLFENNHQGPPISIHPLSVICLYKIVPAFSCFNQHRECLQLGAKRNGKK